MLAGAAADARAPGRRTTDKEKKPSEDKQNMNNSGCFKTFTFALYGHVYEDKIINSTDPLNRTQILFLLSLSVWRM